MKLSLILFLMMLSGCGKAGSSTENLNPEKAKITVTLALTKKGSYLTSDRVDFSCVLRNEGSNALKISKIKAKIRNISKQTSFFQEVELTSGLSLDGGKTYAINDAPIWTVAEGSAKDAYGVYVSYEIQGEKEVIAYSTFFRVVDKSMLTAFEIRKSDYQGLEIFTLDGGMSAEYAVEKAVANLSAGVSQSWDVNPIGGPNQVYATPQFLENSINQTVKTYNDALGMDAVFETVIISTGIPSIPYVSNALKAPVLPLHFLASANTVKEIESIMDYSNGHGLSSYATLSHDQSVPYAVAWIKLLDLPDAYLNFLKQHHVKNIVMMGSTGTSEGETKAKKVLSDSKQTADYSPGMIYIMYPGTSANDQATLRTKIVDIEEVDLQPDFNNIADWESGIIQNQISNFGNSVKKNTTVQSVYSLTANNLLDLYELGSYVTLSFFSKNNLPVKGIVLNPYLIAHPDYESRSGYVPLLYWQMNPPQTTVNRMKDKLQNGLLTFFPKTDFQKLSCWVNSSSNFGGQQAASNMISTLGSNGFSNTRVNDYSRDEVWNPADGMDAICEKVAVVLTKDPAFGNWDRNLQSLTLQDLEKLTTTFPGFVFKKE